MGMIAKDLYLDLMKNTLTHYIFIDSDNSNGLPPQYWRKRKGIKGIPQKILLSLIRRAGLFVRKPDGLTVEKRRHNRENGLDWPVDADTMIGLKRLNNLQMVAETVIRDKVSGDFVETGAWRGGASIFMRAILKAYGITDRAVWVCDSFEGLPPPEPNKYPADHGDIHHTYDILAVSQEEVANNFRRYGLLDDQVRFVKGFFEDTLEHLPTQTISLLRLDGDMYSSTIVALDALYGRVSANGFVIIDDYMLAPCRKAVHDFRDKHGITDEIMDIDGSGAYWRKSAK
jgi:O-methyltransferase